MSPTGQNLGRLPPRTWRIAVASVCGLVAIAALSWLTLPSGLLHWPYPPAEIIKQAPLPLAAAAQTPPAAIPPSFDVLRVGPQGNAVIAGRAMPDAEISILAGGREIAHTRADSQGQWVVTPDQSLAPGARELTVTSQAPSGAVIAGAASVLLMVPRRAEAAPATAVLLPQDGAAMPHLLQGPGGAPGPDMISLDVIDYDEAGSLRLTGHAAPGMAVRIYIDNRLFGDALADPAGNWSLAPHHLTASGHHVVRVDQLTAAGAVQARTEMPFDREVSPAAAGTGTLPAGHLVVQPGQTLWRIARHVYGQGTRYTVIYEANRAHIHDPGRIYPGQTFTIPQLSSSSDGKRGSE